MKESKIKEILQRKVKRSDSSLGVSSIEFQNSRFYLNVEYTRSGITDCYLVSLIDSESFDIPESLHDMVLEFVKTDIESLKDDFDEENGKFNNGCDQYHKEKEDL